MFYYYEGVNIFWILMNINNGWLNSMKKEIGLSIHLKIELITLQKNLENYLVLFVQSKSEEMADVIDQVLVLAAKYDIKPDELLEYSENKLKKRFNMDV